MYVSVTRSDKNNLSYVILWVYIQTKQAEKYG